MKAHWKVLTCLILAFLVTVVLVAQKPAKDIQEPDVNQFPVLDYQNLADGSGKNPKKAKKYNNRYAPKISESLDSIYSNSDWYVGLPALPTAKSDAVIVGEVIGAQARVSEDETNIYSEFTVHISNIPKNDGSALEVGGFVTVERRGGRVRLLSGKVIVAQTHNQDLPRIGRRYVLFLTRDNNEDLQILTGYELRDGRVFPLDKLRPGHPITAYTGTDEAFFLTDLNKVLPNTSISLSR